MLDVPAFCLSAKALSSSSISALGAFFGAFKGLAFPPVVGLIEEGHKFEDETNLLCQRHPF
jgi:hypothetical protein